jgi:hypothetical protein
VLEGDSDDEFDSGFDDEFARAAFEPDVGLIDESPESSLMSGFLVPHVIAEDSNLFGRRAVASGVSRTHTESPVNPPRRASHTFGGPFRVGLMPVVDFTDGPFVIKSDRISSWEGAILPASVSDGNLESFPYIRLIGKGDSSTVYTDISFVSHAGDVKTVSVIIPPVTDQLLDYALFTPLQKKPTQLVVIKRLSKHRHAESIFWREVGIFRAIASIPHPNLLQLVSAFTLRRNNEDVHNMVFPLAYGNLAQLFDAKLDLRVDGNKSEALWSQFHGLVHALAHLHDELEVVHTDLRSSNVLVFVTDSFPGVLLKIADFGYSSHIDDLQGGAGAWTPSHLRSGGMPSIRNLLSNGADTMFSATDLLSNDIWSLGCIFTELATYLVGGSRLIARSCNYRTIKTPEYTTNDFCLESPFQTNPRVFPWLDELSGRDSTNRVKQLPLATMLHAQISVTAHDLAKILAEVRASVPSMENNINVVQASFSICWDGTRFLRFVK